MAKGHVYLDGGSIREPKTRFGATEAAASPIGGVIDVYPGDTLATLTERAYGANTPALRAKLARANANLNGTVNVPR